MRPLNGPPRLGGVRRDAPVPPPVSRPMVSEPERVPEPVAAAPCHPDPVVAWEAPAQAPAPALRRLPPGAALWRATVSPVGAQPAAQGGADAPWAPAQLTDGPVPVRRVGARRVAGTPEAPKPVAAPPPLPAAAPVPPPHWPDAIGSDLPEEAGAGDLAPSGPAVVPPAPDEAPMGVIALEPLHPLRRGRAPEPPRRRRDPAPSRIAYRLNRLWLTPLVRTLVRVGLPAWAMVMVAGLVIGDAERQARLMALWQDLRSGVEERPEFQVTGVEIDGASDPVAAALSALGPQAFPVSSFRLDLDALREEFEALDAVARADLRVRSDGVLVVAVTERVPAAIWRTDEGLWLIDDAGYRVARLLDRAVLPDLPLIAGEGADRAVAEALSLADAAAVLEEAFVGLLRVGGRRWDVVLDSGLRIQLPEAEALAALERVLAQNEAEELLFRDVAAVDMRLPGRPTLRLNPAAVEELRRTRAREAGGGTRP